MCGSVRKPAKHRNVPGRPWEGTGGQERRESSLVPNPKQKIMKIRCSVFLNTSSVPGNSLEVFTSIALFNPHNSPGRRRHRFKDGAPRSLESRQLSAQPRPVCIQNSGWWSHHPASCSCTQPDCPWPWPDGSPGQGDLWERSQWPRCLKPRGLGRVGSTWHTADHSQLARVGVRAWNHSLPWCCPRLPGALGSRLCPQAWPPGLMRTPHGGIAGPVPGPKPAPASHSPLLGGCWVEAEWSRQWAGKLPYSQDCSVRGRSPQVPRSQQGSLLLCGMCFIVYLDVGPSQTLESSGIWK